jgi:myo-inositol-1-phosphate synthase
MDEETLLNFDFKALMLRKQLANQKKKKPKTSIINMVGGRKLN